MCSKSPGSWSFPSRIYSERWSICLLLVTKSSHFQFERHANVRKQSVHHASVINWKYPAYHYAIETGTASCIELNTLFNWKYIVFIYGFYSIADIIDFLGPKITQIVVQKLGSGYVPYKVGLNCPKTAKLVFPEKMNLISP